MKAYNRRFTKLLVLAKQFDAAPVYTTWEFLFLADYVNDFVTANSDVSILLPDVNPYLSHMKQLWKDVDPTRFVAASDAG